MAGKPTYEELEKMVKELKKEAAEHKRIEEALGLTQFSVDTASVSIFRVNPEGKFLYANDAACQKLGYSREELIGLGVADVDPDYPSGRRVDHWENFKKNRVLTFETRHKTKDGKIFPVEVTDHYMEFEGKEYEFAFAIDISDRKLAEEISKEAHHDLERDVIERTAELSKANEQLKREIEERERAEDELQEKINQLHAILSHAPLVLSAVNLEGEFILSEGKGLEVLGRKPEEFVGVSVFDVFKKNNPDILEYVKKAMSGQSVEAIVEFAGEVFDINYAPIRDKSGEISGVVAVSNIITKHKKAEEALRESEERFRTFAEAAPYGLSIMKPDKTFEYFNPKFTEILGYTSEDMPNKDIWFEKAYPDKGYRDKVMSSWKQKFFSKDTKPGEALPNTWTVRCKDGQEKIIIFKNVLSNDGRHFLTYQDITVQAGAEKSLRESELWMRRMFNSLEEAVLISTPDRVIVDINEAGTRMFGYSKTELINRSTEILHVDHEHYLEFGRHIKDTFDKEQTARLEFDNKRKNGEIFTAERTTSLLKNDEGKPMGIVSVIRDLSEQKRAKKEKEKLEAQLQQAQKMEAMGTLAGGIAHDFNNLLMGIQGNASLMLLDTDSTHSHYEKLQAIEKMVQSGSKLTRQLLGYARKGRYEIKPFNLNKFVMEISETFGRTRKEIMIHLELEERLSTIEADQVQIEQVLLNLYVNAADAMPGGGDLILKTMNVSDEDMKDRLYNPRPGKYIQLNITDTGIGMDKETTDRIFDPFFTTKKMGRGTGLGLASAYGIIKAHGGYIDVDSEIGEGTAFSIYLPASEKEVVKGKEFPEDILKGTETVLFVDDEDMIVDVGEKMLMELGYNVLTARSGKEALELYAVKKEEISVVILDMIMPVISGSAAYDGMKKINPNIKVLLSSGYSIDGQATEILERGCDGFIQKPFNMKELSHKLREIILDKEK